MCERYVLPDKAAAEREFLPDRVWWRFEPRFNVATPQYVPALRLHDGHIEAVMLRWGFIAAAEEGRIPPHAPTRIHAERLEASKTFRDAWLAGQRCIVPAAGFYAWQMTPARYRQPYFLRLAARSVAGFAAVWDRSVGDEDDVLESVAIVTVPQNDLMRRIANTAAAMPAILRRRDYHTWLRGTPLAAFEALQPYPAQLMSAHPVSPRINSTATDDAALIAPVSWTLEGQS
jgi:putative SOS response-associated peptidase YedK